MRVAGGVLLCGLIALLGCHRLDKYSDGREWRYLDTSYGRQRFTYSLLDEKPGPQYPRFPRGTYSCSYDLIDSRLPVTSCAYYSKDGYVAQYLIVGHGTTQELAWPEILEQFKHNNFGFRAAGG